MSGIHIAGTGKYIPQNVVTNDDMSHICDTSDEWIVERTGIRERRFATGEPTWYMGKQAALEALGDAGVQPGEIDAIIGCTVTPDFAFPSLACVLQSELGAKTAFCFDLNAACSGFVYALDTAYRYLATGGANNVLIVCSEVLSKIIDFSDRSTCVLLGDAAAAVVVQKDENSRYYSCLRAEGEGGGALLSRTFDNQSRFVTDRENPSYIKYPPTNGSYMYMAGRDVYRFATRVLPELLLELCKKSGLSFDDIDAIIPHQANIRIIRTASEKLGIGMEKMLVNLDRYGNTASASIPLCIDEMAKSGRLKRGMKLAVAGFGAGLTCGGALFDW